MFGSLSGEGSFEFGGMAYIRIFGPNGVLVIWGRDLEHSHLFARRATESYGPGDTAMVHAAPTPRSRLRSMHVADTSPLLNGKKTGTHEIFMYAGFNGVLGAGNKVYDETWALSLPAFTWQRVNGSQKNARYGYTCHLVVNRQLLSIGGGDMDL